MPRPNSSTIEQQAALNCPWLITFKYQLAFMMATMTREGASPRDAAKTVRWLCETKVEVREETTVNDEKANKADFVRRGEFQNRMRL